MDAINITDQSFGTLSDQRHADESAQSRLRRQMQADALRPVTSGLDEDSLEGSHHVTEIFTSETIEEAIQFLRLNVRTLSSFSSDGLIPTSAVSG